MPFAHPLWVVYSSGTTGLPKPIMHGHGGVVLEHLKALSFHQDLHPGDVFTWYTTTGWMMWNYLAGGLLAGTTIVLYDGSATYPETDRLWRLAAEHGVTYLGVGAPYLVACMKAGLRPGAEVGLPALRAIGSTGLPLPPEAYGWVYEAVKPDLLLGSYSGGTDLCTGFVGPCPLLPVRAGVISGRCLGAAVEAYDEDGKPVTGQVGELVITQPMPSMPVGFYGTMRTEPGTGRATSTCTPGSGGTATGSRSCRTAAASSTAAPTPRSTAAAFGWAPASSTARWRPSTRSATAWSWTLGRLGAEGRLILFVLPAEGAELDDDLRNRLRAALRVAAVAAARARRDPSGAGHTADPVRSRSSRCRCVRSCTAPIRSGQPTRTRWPTRMCSGTSAGSRVPGKVPVRLSYTRKRLSHNGVA